jgi:hypothetical protein
MMLSRGADAPRYPRISFDRLRMSVNKLKDKSGYEKVSLSLWLSPSRERIKIISSPLMGED